jgi:hypothetical protein
MNPDQTYYGGGPHAAHLQVPQGIHTHMPSPVSAPVDVNPAPVPAESIAITASHLLAYPILGPDGFEITVVKFRRLKARDLKGVDIEKADGKFGNLLKFVAAMNGLPGDAYDELDAADVLDVSQKAAPFLGSGTGDKQSS